MSSYSCRYHFFNQSGIITKLSLRDYYSSLIINITFNSPKRKSCESASVCVCQRKFSLSFASKASHSVLGYIYRHLSIPLVTMKCSPSPSRNWQYNKSALCVQTTARLAYKHFISPPGFIIWHNHAKAIHFCSTFYHLTPLITIIKNIYVNYNTK